MKILRKQFKIKLEKGDAGISYAMYFIAIVITLVMFVFFKFNADLYTIEQMIENGLHISETGILTSSQDTIESGYRTSEFEKEIDRLHIVSRYDATSSAKGIKEESQVNLIGRKFTDLLQEHLELAGATPSGDILKMMCGSSAKVSITNANIYEPVYQRTVTKTNAGVINGKGIQKFDFDVTYTITKWIQYHLIYNPDTNEYLSFEKTILASAPSLQNGDIAEGATIEATIATEFAGIRNIFAGIDTTQPTISKNAIQFGPAYNNLTADAIDYNGLNTPIFSNHPTQNKYSVQVTQSADITVTSLDSRQQ